MNRFFYMLITIFGLIASSAEATTVFQENFSGATPGTYGGAIPGSSFTVTGGNVDIVGVLNGSFFTCVANPGGNYVDLIGNQGFGAIQSTPISLIAGDTYAISYTAILQGFDTGSTPTEAYNVNVFTELINPTVVPVSISFVAGSSQADAVLSFISGDNIDGVHGPVLSDITVDQFGTSPAPGPIPGAGLLSYLALGLLRPWVGWVGGSDKGRRKADNAKPADVRFDGRKFPQEGSASDITANAVATIFHNMPGVEGDEEINPFRVHAPRPALSWSFPALEDVYVGRRNAIH